MKNAGKVVQGASLYVLAKITEAEVDMMQKLRKLARVTARAIKPVLFSRSESQSARVPSDTAHPGKSQGAAM
jgi:hypothetical protein